MGKTPTILYFEDINNNPLFIMVTIIIINALACFVTTCFIFNYLIFL
jgi:hypothetical protein